LQASRSPSSHLFEGEINLQHGVPHEKKANTMTCRLGAQNNQIDAIGKFAAKHLISQQQEPTSKVQTIALQRRTAAKKKKDARKKIREWGRVSSGQVRSIQPD
jgi:hypothetical protein